MKYFDLHVHPSFKGGMSTDTDKYNAWEELGLYKRFKFILKKFKQIVNSQANLRRLEGRGIVTVAALISMEYPFARNFIINKILANRNVSPLSREKLEDIRCDRKTYHEMFKNDLHHLENAQKYKDFVIVKKHADIVPQLLNVILSVEGAHNFQDVKQASPDAIKHKSIIDTFTKFKNDAAYRFHHLTLTHLTQQPACVHCFGVKVKLVLDATPELEFRPDSLKCGISPLGEEIIKIAYDTTSTQAILIDVKHMSLVSRLQFYALRKEKRWEHIPIIASHMGVTGTSITDFKLTNITPGKDSNDCDEVFWCSKKGCCDTKFNPWTIGLYDEDICAVLESDGLIGISMDQRIIGQGRIYGEYMSKLEVEKLKLEDYKIQSCPEGYEIVENLAEDKAVDTEFINHKEVEYILHDENIFDLDFSSNKELKKFGYEMIFPLDESEESGAPAAASTASHIDYLANNILHMIKTGLDKGFNGTNGKADVQKKICIGSDLDGIVDALNFPDAPGARNADENNWIETDEYDKLEAELIISIDRCKNEDTFFAMHKLDTPCLVRDIMYNNGMAFLKKHF